MRLDVPEECWETKRAGTRAAVLTVPFDARYPVPPPLDKRLTEEVFLRFCDCPPELDRRLGQLEALRDDGGEAMPLMPIREDLRRELLDRQSAWEEFSQWCRSGTGAYGITGERGCGKTVFLRRCAWNGLGGSVWILLTPNLDPGTVRLYEETLLIPRGAGICRDLKAAMAAWICHALSGEGRIETYGDPAEGWKLFRSFLHAPGQSALLPKLSPTVRQLLSLLKQAEAGEDPGVCRRTFSRLLMRSLQTLCITPGTGVDESFRCVAELFVLTALWRYPRKRLILTLDELDTGVAPGALYDPVPGALATALAQLSRQLPDRCRLVLGIGKRAPLPMEALAGIPVLDVTGWSSLKEIMARKLHYLRKNCVVLQDAYQPRDLLTNTGCSDGRVDELLRELDRLYAWDHRELYDFLCRMYSSRTNRTALRRCIQQRRDPNLPGSESRFLYRSTMLHLICTELLKDDAFFPEETGTPSLLRKVQALGALLTILSAEGKLSLEELLGRAAEYTDLDGAYLLRLLAGFARLQESGRFGLQLFRLRSDYPALRDVSISAPEELEQVLGQDLPQHVITAELGPSGPAFLRQILPEPALCAALCGFLEPLSARIPAKPWEEPPELQPCVLYVSGIHDAEQRLLQTAEALSALDGGVLYRSIRENHSAGLAKVCALVLHTGTDRPEEAQRAALSELVSALCRAWGRPEQLAPILARAEQAYDYPPAQE